MKPNYMSIDDPFNTGGELELKLNKSREFEVPGKWPHILKGSNATE
jgi:hypothetical protein